MPPKGKIEHRKGQAGPLKKLGTYKKKQTQLERRKERADKAAKRKAATSRPAVQVLIATKHEQQNLGALKKAEARAARMHAEGP